MLTFAAFLNSFTALALAFASALAFAFSDWGPVTTGAAPSCAVGSVSVSAGAAVFGLLSLTAAMPCSQPLLLMRLTCAQLVTNQPLRMLSAEPGYCSAGTPQRCHETTDAQLTAKYITYQVLVCVMISPGAPGNYSNAPWVNRQSEGSALSHRPYMGHRYRRSTLTLNEETLAAAITIATSTFCIAKALRPSQQR